MTSLLTTLFLFAAFSVSSASAAYELTSTKCSGITVILDKKDDKKYVIQGGRAGGSVVWEQDDEAFSFTAYDSEYDYGYQNVFISAQRTRKEADAEGRELKRAGRVRSSIVKKREVVSEEKDFETLVEHTGAGESVERSSFDGVAIEPVFVTKRELGASELLFVTRQENVPGAGQMVVESDTRTCHHLTREEKELKDVFTRKIVDAVKSFSAKIVKVDEAKAAFAACPEGTDCARLERKLAEARKARDDSFFGAIDPKWFRAPRPRPQPPRYGGGGGGGGPGYEYGRPQPFPGTPYRDWAGNPVYRDVFGDYKGAGGLPANPRDVRDEHGFPVCNSPMHAPRNGC